MNVPQNVPYEFPGEIHLRKSENCGKKGKWLFRIAEIWEIRGGFFRWSPKNTPTFSPYGGKSRRTKKIPVKSRDFFERRGLAP
jgi:hypothetical protein